jgi:hypothetical protein
MIDLPTLNYSSSPEESTHSPPALGRYVSEAEYWEKYYNYPETIYEWNNGYLEEKPVSDFLTILMYKWFFQLLEHYLGTHHIAETTLLEMGFNLVLPSTIETRRPDLGVVLHSNQVPLKPTDKSYQGTFDICIEALSDSSKTDIERDTVDKKNDYAAAGVKEYYILDGHNRHTEFYRLNAKGIYVPIKPIKGCIIKSKVLPGFQFRLSDLSSRPTPDEMIDDSVYQDFVLPGYAESKKTAVAEKLARQKAERSLNRAEQRAEQEQQRAERLAQQLRALGINPDDF